MNSSNKLNNELLTAYFDGELSQAEQLQVEQALFDSPDCLRQLREWAVLREALQNTSVVIQAQAGLSGDRQVANEPSAAEAAVMNRIAAALSGGEVKWASGGSLQAAAASFDGASVAGEPPKVGRNNSHVAEVVAPRIAEPTPELPRGDRWPSNFHRLNPTQRLRRWRWQLVAISTVAASMLLAVFMNQKADGPPMAGADGSRGDGNVDRSTALGERESAGLSSRMAIAAPAASSDSDVAGALENVAGGSGGVPSNAMISEANVDASMLSTNANSTPTIDYTTFVSFDVPDASVGLQQMKSVLADNQLGPGEIYKLDDSQVVVLTGDAKKLAEVLKVFQAIGGNSLALLAKVSPEGLDSPIAGAQGMGQSAESAQNQGMETVVPPNESIAAQDSNSNPGISSPEENVGGQNSMAAGLPGQSLASIGNFRQDVIRRQANVLNNLVSPPANVSIEEFLNHRPAPKGARVPFALEPGTPEQGTPEQGTPQPGVGGDRSAANQGIGAQTTQILEGQGVESSIVPSLPTDRSAKSRHVDQPGHTGVDRSAASRTSPAVSGDQTERQIQASRVESTNSAAANLDPAATNNSGPTQIVVILRPKTGGQQSPNNQNP